MNDTPEKSQPKIINPKPKEKAKTPVFSLKYLIGIFVVLVVFTAILMVQATVKKPRFNEKEWDIINNDIEMRMDLQRQLEEKERERLKLLEQDIDL